MDDAKKRIKTWINDYSSISIKEAEKIINVKLSDLFNDAIPVIEMFDTYGKVSAETSSVKDKIYERLVEYIKVEDFPMGGIEGFKKASVGDIVSVIMICVISSYQDSKNEPKIKLRREQELITIDSK